MNTSIVIGIVLRHSLTAAGFYLAQRGVIDASEVEAGVGAVLTIVGLAWSAWQKRKQG